MSSTAPEGSVVCVAQPSSDCPECQAGYQHQCTGGSWRPVLSQPCGAGPQVAAPPEAPGEQHPPGSTDAPSGTEQEQCIHYDQDGRRIDLNREDLAWAKESGLITRTSCY